MIEILSALSFAGLIAAQFLAVAVVHHERTEHESGGHRFVCHDAREWNAWLLA